MHGRFFLKLALTTAGVALGFSALTSEATAASKKRRIKAPEEEPAPEPVQKPKELRTKGPSVLLVVADGLGDWVGWLGGHPQLRTPNMDRLSRMGVRFTNATAPSSLSNPSRTALLTSLAPWQSGVTTDELDWRRVMPLQGKPTLPEHFRFNGFITAGAGKVFHASHAGPKTPSTDPNSRGGIRGMEQDTAWDERFPKPGAQMPDFPVKLTESFNGLKDWSLDWAALDAKPSQMPDDQVVTWAEKFLAEKQKNPTFLTVGLSGSGAPWFVPRKYFEMFPLAGIQLPPGSPAETQAKAGANNPDAALNDLITQKQNLKPAIQARLAAVAYCDAMIGRLLDALEKSPQKDSTILVFTSDRGQMMGQGGRWSAGSLAPAATHVPLVVYAPGVTTADGVCSQPVSLVDIYATLCELAEVTPPENLGGLSFVSQLKDPGSVRNRPALSASGKAENADYTATTDAWRYTRLHDGTESLFAIAQGISLGGNVAAQPEHAELKETLKALFPQKWASPYRTFDLVKFDASADGAATYWLQTGDSFGGEHSPDVAGRGVDFEFNIEYSAAKDANSVLISQGTPKYGFAIHLLDGKPAFTVNYDGLRTVLKSKEPLKDGPVTLRALLGLDGTLAVGAAVGPGTSGYAPFEGGFPRKLTNDLTVALASDVLPNVAPFVGEISRANISLLPGLTVELRAAKAMPVE